MKKSKPTPEEKCLPFCQCNKCCGDLSSSSPEARVKKDKCSNCGKPLSDCDKSCYYQEDEARVDWEERCKWLTEAMDNYDSRLTVHLLRNWDNEKRIRFCLHILGDKFQASFEKGREAR